MSATRTYAVVSPIKRKGERKLPGSLVEMSPAEYAALPHNQQICFGHISQAKVRNLAVEHQKAEVASAKLDFERNQARIAAKKQEAADFVDKVESEVEALEFNSDHLAEVLRYKEKHLAELVAKTRGNGSKPRTSRRKSGGDK